MGDKLDSKDNRCYYYLRETYLNRRISNHYDKSKNFQACNSYRKSNLVQVRPQNLLIKSDNFLIDHLGSSNRNKKYLQNCMNSLKKIKSDCISPRQLVLRQQTCH